MFRRKGPAFSLKPSPESEAAWSFIVPGTDFRGSRPIGPLINDHLHGGLRLRPSLKAAPFILNIAFFLPVALSRGVYWPSTWQCRRCMHLPAGNDSFKRDGDMACKLFRVRCPLSTDCTDTTYFGVIGTLVEPCISLLCGCFPVIRGLFPSCNLKSHERVKWIRPALRRNRKPAPESVADAEFIRVGDSPMDFRVIVQTDHARGHEEIVVVR